MPDSILPPSVEAQLADLERRVSALERQGGSPATQAAPKEIVFSYSGPLTASVSPPIRSRYSNVLVSVNFTLGTAGTTDTVIEIRRGGSAVRTTAIPAGATTHEAVVDVDIGADQDDITMAITTAGTGAVDLVGQARFS